MFEALVERIINKILGQYVEDFSSENLKIGLWSGQVVIRNIKLKKEIIKLLNLPFNLKYSRLGCLKMNIPWKSLTSSKIDVVVQGLQLLITQVPEAQWVCRNTKIIEARKKQIQKYCEAVVADFEKKNQQSKKQEEEQGYFSKMIVKIIDNIQVTVKDIHVRFEDEITKKYSFGVTLEELKIFTVNKHDEPEFIDRTLKQYENQPLRKKLLLSNFGFYWNERSQFFPENTMHQKMVSTIARKDSTKRQFNYLILMSSNAKLLQRQSGKQFAEPQINLLIDFKQLKIQITNQQLQQIVTQAQRLQKFTKKVKAENRKKLTQLQMIANRELFLKLFPQYYEKKIDPKELEKMEKILEKMEVANFTEGIKQYMMIKEKQKMLEKKKKENSGWFSGWFSGPKEVNKQETEEIEKFLKENFGQEVSVIKRPPEYEFIRVNFNLQKLEIIIANQKVKKNCKEGIQTKIEMIMMEFNLREKGYALDFTLDDLKVDLFKKSLTNSEDQEMTPLVKKLLSAKVTSKQYMKLKVLGSPLDKPHLDTQIILRTQEVLFLFDPKVIKIGTDFANIKVNSENTEAVIETYGQIKNIASNAATTAMKKPIQKKNFISLDVTINAINVIIFFDSFERNHDCWALVLGQTRVFTDPQTLKKPDFKFDEPMEKYCLSLSNMSLTHYESQNIFLQKRHSKQVNYKSRVLDDLHVDFEAELFQTNTTQIPKIRGKAAMRNLNLYLSDFTYQKIQKIGDCFAVEQEQSVIKEKQVQKSKQKTEVMSTAKKLGILYQQKGTEDPKKFIAVLSGGYIYLYADKKDIHYAEYYYVKNSVFRIETETLPHQKPYSFELSNSVNNTFLAFDKEKIMNDWMDAIKKLDEQEFVSVIKEEKALKKKESVIEKNPNLLNFEVTAAIKDIKVVALLPNEKNITIQILNVVSHVKLHELKVVLGVSLQKILLKDNIYEYKMKRLEQFLSSVPLQNFDKLIDIQILQLNFKHPEYCLVDNQINVHFGKLQCNYKPETVENLMLFFLPKPSTQVQAPKQTEQISSVNMTKSEIEFNQLETRRRLAIKILAQILMKQPEKFAMKVNVIIQEIAVGLINCKNRVYFGQLNLKKFQVNFGQSSRKMVLKGSLGEMCYADLSGYPHTIHEEQEEYPKRDYIMKAIDSQRDMVEFDIQILELANSDGKKMLIYTSIKDLQASFVQQPVLRILTYLTEQMLPSLTPTSPGTQKQAPKNDIRPQLSPMLLVTELQNIRALVEPRTEKKEQLRLNIGKILVKNSNHYRDYLQKASEIPEQDRVLVENYSLNMKNINISVNYNNKFTKLTNDLDFDVSCDLIQNSAYYTRIYKDRFLPGMRINCSMSAFLMKISHDDYNFMMKCLFWNIAYDDNADGYMFNGPPVSKDQNTPPPPSDPFFMKIDMDKISLCVTEDDFPISVLVLNKMGFSFYMNPDGMQIDLEIKKFFGTNLSKIEGNQEISIQRGLFNSFGYEKVHNTKDLYDLDKLVQFFHHNEILQEETTKPVIFFKMALAKAGDIFMQVIIQELKIAIQLKNLLILSKLALMQDSIQPPKSKIVPKNKVQPPPPQPGKMQMILQLNNFMASLSDKTCKNYVVMQGSTIVKLLMLPSGKTEDEIIHIGNTTKKSDRFLEIASHVVQLRNFSIYFCNIRDLKNKRFILKPLHLFISFKQFYQRLKGKISHNEKDQSLILTEGMTEGKDFCVIEVTQIQGTIEKLIFQSSIKDLLELSIISQDNMKVLAQQTTPPPENKKPQLKEGENIKKVDEKEIKKDLKIFQKKILSKMKAFIKLQPIHFQMINDLNNNFMPVLQFTLQQSTLLFNQDPIKMHYFQSIIFNVGFFNPRSSKYEPVIEKYQMSLNYLSCKTQFGPLNKIIIESSQLEELKQMRINVSTQFIAAMMATLQIWKEQQKKRQEKNKKYLEKKLSYKNKSEPELQEKMESKIQSFEVSPFIIENLTNSSVHIIRKIDGKQDVFKVPSRFSGPVRLSDNVNDVQDFKFMFMEQQYNMSLEHYGIVKMKPKKGIKRDKWSYFLEYKIDKLNRIIRFMGSNILKNCTSSGLYVNLFNKNKEKLGETVFVESGKLIPVFAAGGFQVSLNNNTWTHMGIPSYINDPADLRAESGKYKLSVSKKRRMHNQYIIEIRSPLIINNCLPKDVSLQFIQKGKTLSTKLIKSQVSHEVFANQNMQELQFKLIADGFYWSRQFTLQNIKIGKEEDLFLGDRIKGGTTLKIIFDKTKNSSQFILNVYCKGFILSELDQNLNVYGNLERDEKNKGMDRFYVLGGQNQFWNKEKNAQTKELIDPTILVGSQTGSKIKVCGVDCQIELSEPVLISGLGINHNRVVVKKIVNGKPTMTHTVVGADVSLRQMIKGSNIFLRQITLRYRLIVQNNSNFNLLIKEESSRQYLFEIEKGQKKPFHSPMQDIRNRSQRLVFKSKNTNQSYPIASDGLGTMYFKLINLQTKKYSYFKLEIQQVKSYLFYIIQQIQYQNLPYQIVVRSPSLEVQVPALKGKIKKDDKPLCFINQIPNQPFNLFIQVHAIGTNRVSQMVVEPDNLNFLQKDRFYEEGKTKSFIPAVVHIQFLDNRRVVVVQEIFFSEKLASPEYETSTINFKLDKFSLSLIQNHQNVEKPYESFYFYFYNFQFFSEVTNKRTKYQAKLQFLQFDQCQPFNLPNPVVMTPTKYKQFTQENEKRKLKYIFNSYIEIDNSFVKNMFFNMIAVEMNDLALKVSTLLLKVILKMSKQFTQVISNQQENQLIERRINTWNDQVITTSESNTFIKAIRLAPFTVEISAQVKLDQLDADNFIFFGTVLNALGVVITNIQDAPICFDGIILENCVDTMAGINKKLMEHYKSTVLKQLYKIFGALNILGNPTGLFRNITTGFKDLKDKPSEGFVEGPLQFGKGLAQGTTSLIAHSVGGALNSVEKFTGTVASGLAVLTFDKEFEEMREKERMKKPKHVFQGLEKGGKAVFHGFKEGITGLFTQPYQNAKKQGVIGFFKGTAKGIAGVVVKPVTGVIDGASKTTQGLKNTALYLEDKPNSNRIRYPRVFYTECSTIRDYNPLDSKLFGIISKTKYEQKYNFENALFINSYITGKEQYLLLLKEDIVVIQQKKIEYAVPIESAKLKREGNGVRIESKDRRKWYESKVNEFIVFGSEQDRKQFLQEAAELQNLIKDQEQQNQFMEGDD